jgi:hypothetical protein
MKTKGQTLAVHWNAPVSFACPTRCKTKHPTMKALIVYDDATCAATTNAILHRAADRADISVKWDIRPWRLNMLRFTPIAEEAMSDAADAHLIVFAIRNTRSLPTWLMNWLERWAVLRQFPGVALAVIGCGTAEASVELHQFARRFGLSFIQEGQKSQLGVGFLIEAVSTEYKFSMLPTPLDCGNRPNDCSIAFMESTSDAHCNEQSEPLCKNTGLWDLHRTKKKNNSKKIKLYET